MLGWFLPSDAGLGPHTLGSERLPPLIHNAGESLEDFVLAVESVLLLLLPLEGLEQSLADAGLLDRGRVLHDKGWVLLPEWSGVSPVPVSLLLDVLKQSRI